MTRRIFRKAATIAVPGALLYAWLQQPVIIVIAILAGGFWITVTELELDH